MNTPAPPTDYPPKGVTIGMWADRVVLVGSQEVMAAKCCPGQSLAAKEETRRTRFKEHKVKMFVSIQMSSFIFGN